MRFLNENVWISLEISLKFVPKGSIKNIPALVQIMTWRRPVDKPLSEPMMVSWLARICVTRPQWFKVKQYGIAPINMMINSLGPCDAIWCNRSWSTSVHVMACCPRAPEHYTNQCWLALNKVLYDLQEMLMIWIIYVWMQIILWE